MLVVFPLALPATAVLFDLVNLATGMQAFALVAYWTMAAGIAGGLLAAPFGLVDWLHIPPGTRARRIGMQHGAGSLVVMALFAAAWLLRRREAELPVMSLALALTAAALVPVTAWLGGELVSRLGVGVYEDAGLDAPSSLHLDEQEPVASHPPAKANR